MEGRPKDYPSTRVRSSSCKDAGIGYCRVCPSVCLLRDSTQFHFNAVIEGDYQIWWDKLPPGCT